MTLYRKYRPQKISELDIEEVRNRLLRVLSSSFIPHAFLFCGPKGTGKTSAARIVAKVLNCERKTESHKDTSDGDRQSRFNRERHGSSEVEESDLEPCNVCETCISITEGRNLDILEIDAASNRGIEEIRDLREKIRLAPLSLKYKVYIIDEVHMLTTEAFNALLKTLEEPPPHAIFILATTEPDKLPETIVSRCTKFVFHRANKNEILHSLKRVAAGEKLTVSDDILSEIADSADGSFRDATKLLEQTVSEGISTLEGISAMLGKGEGTGEQFLKLLLDKKTTELLQIILRMGEKGTDFRLFISDILQLLHALLLTQYGIKEKEVSLGLVKMIDKKDLSVLIKLFSRVYVELKSSSRPELPLEIAIVEWCES